MARTISWVFFFALAYLLLVSLLWRLIHLPTLNDIGFTLVFTAFSASHAWAALGGKRTLAFFGLSAVVSWLFEFVGVWTGAVYGPYHYGAALGVTLGGVPAIIPLAWFMMIYPSWQIAGILLGPAGGRPWTLVARSSIAAMVMTMWDTIMDPGMAASGAWVWERGGPYFGVPLRNYLGWLVTTFAVYLLAGAILRAMRGHRSASAPRAFRLLPVVIYALLAATYLTPRRMPSLEPLRVVAAFTMGFVSVLSLFRLALEDESAAVRSGAQAAPDIRAAGGT